MKTTTTRRRPAAKQKAILARRAEIAQEKKAETRLMLLHAAFEVLGHEDGRDMQIEDLLSHVGMSRGTFYNYFESREDLFNVLSFDFNHGLDEALAQSGEPALWACQAIRIYLHRAQKDRAWGWAMVNISMNGPKILGDDTYRHGAVTLQAGMDSGDFKIANVQIGMDLVMGTALAAIMSILKGNAGPDHPEHVAKALLMSLGVPAAKAERLANQPLPPFPMGKPQFTSKPSEARVRRVTP
jgi:AcrR family transcriptional regulator